MSDTNPASIRELVDWRDRGKARPTERARAVADLWINEHVSLDAAERIVSHWEWQRWLIEKGKVER